MKLSHQVLPSLIPTLILTQFFLACKPIQPLYEGYTPIASDSLIRMEEALQFYSQEYLVEMDKEHAGRLIEKVQTMLNDTSLTRIYLSNQLPDTLFQIMELTQTNYLKYLYQDFPDHLLEFTISGILNDSMTNKSDLANAGEPYNATCRVRDELPYRQLQFAIKGNESYLLYYMHGRGIIGSAANLVYLDLSGKGETITFTPGHRPTDEIPPLGFRDICYFKGEVYNDFTEVLF